MGGKGLRSAKHALAASTGFGSLSPGVALAEAELEHGKEMTRSAKLRRNDG